MEKRIRVLVVDDEPNVSKTLTLLLEARGYTVDVAETGKEAFEKALNRPDIVLLDVVLPDVTGFDVCRKLREHKATKDIPIIILSVRNMYEDKIEGLYLGADDYITKPFEYEELFARMEVVLRRRQAFEVEDSKEKAQMIQELRGIIDNELLTPFFQPIFSINPTELLGVEVLTRPPTHGLLSTPDILFQAAMRFGRYHDLEMLGWRKALAKISEGNYKGKIFLNCNPYLIESSELYQIEAILNDYDMTPDRVVFEITERSAIVDYKTFYERLHEYQKKGFSIAIDDAGGGYASLESIVETNPQYVKIDLGIIRGVEENSLKRSVVKFVVSFCKENKIISIAEGIEQKKELDTLLALGVDAGQGYFLGKPQTEIQTEIYGKKS
ncbi:MAG: EAL domain-containing protein [Candidatus Aceula meridiana]|nr:EAL domain-containing protein [Candidatus Aceula meridiana]